MKIEDLKIIFEVPAINTLSMLVLLVLVCPLLCSSTQPPHAQPNVVLMLVDELGTGDVPWTDREIIAPTIKSLGEGGLRLGTSYAWHWCAPTRGGTFRRHPKQTPAPHNHPHP